MKVFISWSGDYSREVAEKLSEWIPSIIQSVDTFFSPDDIGKGENWNNVLSKELNDCNFGIVCLTPENVAAPWIHFEAGALAKTLDSHVSSVMLGLNPSDVKGPLSRFQNTKFERNDFFKLVQAINDASDKPLNKEKLAYSFDIFWERLVKEVGPIMKKYESISRTLKVPSKTNDYDAIQEILSIVRKMSTSTLSDKGMEIADIESQHIIPNNPASKSEVQLYLSLRKRFPINSLSDRTKKLLRVLEPKDIFDKAISSLEDYGKFSQVIFTNQVNAQTIVDILAGRSDLVVTTYILNQ